MSENMTKTNHNSVQTTLRKETPPQREHRVKMSQVDMELFGHIYYHRDKPTFPDIICKPEEIVMQSAIKAQPN